MVPRRTFSINSEDSGYELIPSKFFLNQLDDLDDSSKKLLKEKVLLVKINPYRYKRIKGYDLFLFRIRFEDGRKEKRLIYLLEKPKIKVLCILDRDKEYKDLKKFLKVHGYI
jgi:mRNA-degrading endonuclease RelE of RelBE toxin-antitoxin system